ncbi:hypothetical protein D6T17_22225 [Salmonella enterica subsp. enterica serovar Oranienburg]|nr:hypothetical protein [Salmonella enterica subsp. enterica serovar Oranienburg]EBY8946999.1 hypothetical protein [Salmonella enterica subsp. enterica serovar Oranienburg]
MLFFCAGMTVYGKIAEVFMSRNIVHGLPEVVYSLICENPGVFKYDLKRMAQGRLNIRITESDLSDVISCLKLHRGVFVMRGYGYFKDEEAFNNYSPGIIPGKEIRRKWRQPDNGCQ